MILNKILETLFICSVKFLTMLSYSSSSIVSYCEDNSQIKLLIALNSERLVLRMSFFIKVLINTFLSFVWILLTNFLNKKPVVKICII